MTRSSANVCLRDLERTRGEEVRRITFRARPTARAVRHELFNTLGLPGEPPRHPSEFDRLLLDSLAAQPRTLVVDEAQWLNRETFEYFRFLWDHPYTQIAIIFAGGEGAHSVLRKEPMLSSRIFIWQHVTKLTLDEVQQVIPLYHPVWANTDPIDIAYADRHATHGNFRNWARLTAHASPHSNAQAENTPTRRCSAGPSAGWAAEPPGRRQDLPPAPAGGDGEPAGGAGGPLPQHGPPEAARASCVRGGWRSGRGLRGRLRQSSSGAGRIRTVSVLVTVFLTTLPWWFLVVLVTVLVLVTLTLPSFRVR
ncbi:AAA family ATPase, partial [Streptomyces avidinii]|uniref:AAA family ATPase n=1 Tax=Streptomyces avidinii TaxID=1895 RepID=UPI0037AEBBDE